MPRRYIYADEDKDDEQLIWDALGRGSAAGRHLYNLYNGNTDGKRFGNMQSAYNGEVESRKTAEERRLPMEVEDAAAMTSVAGGVAGGASAGPTVPWWRLLS